MSIDRDYLDRLVGNRGVEGVPPFCVYCGYNLTGSAFGRCPECGSSFDELEWRKRAAAIKRLLEEVEEASVWARWGLITGGVALLTLLVCLVLPAGCYESPLRLGAGGAGFAAFFMGVNVFRCARLPAWARERLQAPPAYPQAGASMLVGVLDMALAMAMP